MKPLDYINQELHRVQGRLDKILPEANNLEAERDQLLAAKIVIQRAAGAVAGEPDPQHQPARRGRKPGSVNAPRDADESNSKPSTADMILKILEHMPSGGTKEDISTALEKAGHHVRANHLGIALQRHKRGDRLIESDGRWTVIPHKDFGGAVTQPNGEEHAAA